MIATREIRISKETIELLRFPFSLYLAPVYLFAISQAPVVHWPNALLIFFILHILVYPASNGFNSYMDCDTTSIGGLENPPQPSYGLYIVTLAMDLVAIVLSLFINVQVAVLVAMYIMASRAYSDRRIRLKKFAWIGFFVVTVFQGGIVYLIVYLAVTPFLLSGLPDGFISLSMLVSSLIIGASYPLTQIYQHAADKENGDRTLSLALGYKGTFLFSATLFSLAMIAMYLYFQLGGNTWKFHLFVLFTLPILAYFAWWFIKVLNDKKHADFKNTMRMNSISAACMALYFLTLIILNIF